MNEIPHLSNKTLFQIEIKSSLPPLDELELPELEEEPPEEVELEELPPEDELLEPPFVCVISKLVLIRALPLPLMQGDVSSIISTSLPC